MADGTPIRIADGSWDFSGGVDSGKVTTLKSNLNPNGLDRNQLAWAQNATVRGGPISPRNGWFQVCTIRDNPEVFGGAFMYDPDGENFPYPIVVLNGVTYAVRIDIDNSVHDLSTAFGLTMPVLNGYFFAQAERFLVIQAGDYQTLPNFWDGATLRQSKGITNPAVPPGTPGVNEIPPAGPMNYYQGRLWYAQGRQYGAGDIVDGPSGTLAFAFTDAVLNVTENPLVVGGDGFTIPSQDGNIRAIADTANMNTQLGEGQLYIFTRNNIYSLTVPISRTDWIAASNNNQPLQTVVQRKFGATSYRSVIPVNGDLFYRTMEPGIRSLSVALRDFQQWGNTPISTNVNRIIGGDDRNLLRFATGMAFDNRLWQGCQPFDIPGVGAGFRAAAILDFNLVSSFEDKLSGRAIPAWEGGWEGTFVLQYLTGDFGGRERAFAVVFSQLHNAIELWELTDFARRDNGDNRIQWYFETPAYTWGKEFDLKELDGLELWIDELFGLVDFLVEYKVDQDPCWRYWARWRDCAARGPGEDVPPTESPYPQRAFCDQYRFPYVLPKPPVQCAFGQNRPSNQGFQFQVRVTIKGWCRVRGILLYALPKTRPAFGEKFICASPEGAFEMA